MWKAWKIEESEGWTLVGIFYVDMKVCMEWGLLNFVRKIIQ